MRGAVAAALAVLILFLGLGVGLSINRSTPVETRTVISVTTKIITIPISLAAGNSSKAITFTHEVSKTYLMTQTVIKELTSFLTYAVTITALTTSTQLIEVTTYIIKSVTFTGYTTSTKTVTSHTTLTSIVVTTEYTTFTKTTTETKSITRTYATTKTVTATVRTTEIAPTFGIEDAEVDMIAEVYKVIDGDTFDAFPSGRVRLADINTPEVGEPGYQEAKNALTSLLLNKEVYLDIDDLYVMDKYNRLICLVFIDYNSTHVLNVNKWLLENGYAEISDYPNEFNPNTWKLYHRKS